MKPLSSDFVKNLIAKAEKRELGHKPVFSETENKLIKDVVKEGATSLTMRGRKFHVRYFRFRKKEWVTVRPVRGFIPMFSSPKDEVLHPENVI